MASIRSGVAKPSVNVSYVALNSSLPRSLSARHSPRAARSCGTHAELRRDVVPLLEAGLRRGSIPLGRREQQVTLHREEKRRKGPTPPETSSDWSMKWRPSDGLPACAAARART